MHFRILQIETKRIWSSKNKSNTSNVRYFWTIWHLMGVIWACDVILTYMALYGILSLCLWVVWLWDVSFLEPCLVVVFSQGKFYPTLSCDFILKSWLPNLCPFLAIMSMHESFAVVACFNWLKRGKLRLIMLTTCLVQIFNRMGIK